MLALANFRRALHVLLLVVIVNSRTIHLCDRQHWGCVALDKYTLNVFVHWTTLKYILNEKDEANIAVDAAI